MQTKEESGMRATWSGWAAFLRCYGLESMTAWLLEAAGPLTLFGAQMLYLGGPLLRSAMTDQQQQALASLFEHRDEALAFASFLREEITF